MASRIQPGWPATAASTASASGGWERRGRSAACAAAALLAAWPEGARAAQPVFQAPELVWESTGRTSGPQIVVDAAGRAHLFFQDATESGAAVALYHVDLDAGPPYAPRDVLVGLGTDSRDYRTAADPLGNVHVLFTRENQLWHVSAAGTAAHDAGGWTVPVSLGPSGPGAELALDQDGRVHVCFPRADEVRYVQSDDGGASWGRDELVAVPEFPAIPVYLACAVDLAGAIHVAWAEAEPPSFYPSKRVRYSRSDDRGVSWSEPETVAGEHYTMPELLADGSGRVHMLWQADIGLGGRQYRRLEAGADSWSAVETVVPVGRGGMSGDAPLAVDGDGGVHVVTSAPEPVWVGRGPGGWGEDVALAAALAGEQNITGSIENPAFAIQNGNVAHVAFEFDFKRIYYVVGLLDAAEVRAVPRELPASMARRPRRTDAVVAADGDEGGAAAAGSAGGGTGAAGVPGELGAAGVVTASGAAGDGDPVGGAVPVTGTARAWGDAPWPGAGGRGWLLWVGPALAAAVVGAAMLLRRAAR